MPPLPNIPGVIKIRHRHTIAGDTDVLVIWHWAYTGGPPTDTDCANLADDIAGYYATDMLGLLNGNITFTGIDVTDLSGPSAGFGTVTVSHAGTRSGGDLAAGTAMLVSMPIARRYRGGKPRSYWPWGVSGDLVDQNTWDSTIISAAESLLATYTGQFPGTSQGSTVLSDHVSVSYYEGFTSVLNPITGRTRDVPKVRTGAIPVDPILAYTPSVKVSSQRRRNQQRR